MATSGIQDQTLKLTGSAYDRVVASAEGFRGNMVAGDALVTLSSRPGGSSRLSRAVFLRDEIDAGVVHALAWSDDAGLPPTASRMADAVALLSVQPCEVPRLVEAAASRGFTVTRIGWAAAERDLRRRASR